LEAEDESSEILQEDPFMKYYSFNGVKQFIDNLDKIPMSFRQLDWSLINKHRVIELIHKYIFKYSPLFSTPEAFEYLYHLFTQNPPQEIAKALQESMGESISIVISL